MVSLVPQEKRIKDVSEGGVGHALINNFKEMSLGISTIGRTTDHGLGPEPKVPSYGKVVFAQPISPGMRDSLPPRLQLRPSPREHQCTPGYVTSAQAGVCCDWREACISSPGLWLEKTGREPADQ